MQNYERLRRFASKFVANASRNDVSVMEIASSLSLLAMT